jgi:hypothetical protein
VSEIEIIELHTDTGTRFTLSHPYDLTLLDCGLADGQFADRDGAERAAATIMTAVTGGDD